MKIHIFHNTSVFQQIILHKKENIIIQYTEIQIVNKCQMNQA